MHNDHERPIDIIGQFRWPIHKSGYRWVNDYIVPIDPSSAVWGERQSLEGQIVSNKEDTFFTGFANISKFDTLDEMKEAFVKYANHFGRLENFGKTDYIRDNNGSPVQVILNDNISFWIKEYFELRWILWLYESQNDSLSSAFYIETLRHDNQMLSCYVSEPEIMSEHLRRQSIPNIRRNPSLEEVSLATKYKLDSNVKPYINLHIFENTEDGQDAFRAYRSGNLKGVAKIFLQILVNKKLSEFPPKWRLLRDFSGKLHPSLIPENLISAVWLQFSQSLSETRKLRRCEICKQIQDVTGRRERWSRHPQCKGSQGELKRRERIAANILQEYENGKSVYEISAQRGLSEREVNAKIRKALTDRKKE